MEGSGRVPRPTKAQCSGERASVPVWAPDRRKRAPLKDTNALRGLAHGAQAQAPTPHCLCHSLWSLYQDSLSPSEPHALTQSLQHWIHT